MILAVKFCAASDTSLVLQIHEMIWVAACELLLCKPWVFSYLTVVSPRSQIRKA